MPQVLVVEDDRPTHSLFTTLVRRNGFDSVEAYDGVQALACIRRGRPDAIVLDLILPNLDGFAFLRELNRTFPDLLPITIVVTAAAEFMLRDCPELERTRAVLTKPLDVERLIEELLWVVRPAERARTGGH